MKAFEQLAMGTTIMPLKISNRTLRAKTQYRRYRWVLSGNGGGAAAIQLKTMVSPKHRPKRQRTIVESKRLVVRHEGFTQNIQPYDEVNQIFKSIEENASTDYDNCGRQHRKCNSGVENLCSPFAQYRMKKCEVYGKQKLARQNPTNCSILTVWGVSNNGSPSHKVACVDTGVVS
jgi:hypothetical protein